MQNPLQPLEELAGVVLCGGQSRRMGVPKYRLPFGEETLLQRICRIVAGVANPVVLVGSAEQDLSDIRPSGRVVRDTVADQGPLRGLLSGLTAILSEGSDSARPATAPIGTISAVFVTSCDVPLLSAPVIRLLAGALDADHDAVVIESERRRHPLCAVYRCRSAALAAERLLESGERRMTALPEALRTRILQPEQLSAADPNLDCLLNCNTPEQYQIALQRLRNSPHGRHND